jgi:2-keto-4-pentenoate hydratase
MSATDQMSRDRVERAAALLFETRRTNAKLAGLPADVRPISAEEAYAIQDEVTRLEGLQIGGWKVGLLPGVRLTHAPIYAPVIHESPARAKSAEVSSLIIEGEVAFHLARDLPVRDRDYVPEEVAEAVAMACAAIEIGDPRLEDFMPGPLEHKIADNMGNGLLIWGTGTQDWGKLDRARLPVKVEVDGKTVAQALGGNNAGDPFAALVALANAPFKREDLKAGQIVITGTCTGMYRASPGSMVVVTFDGLGEARVVLD